jgi:hypothetical protein
MNIDQYWKRVWEAYKSHPNWRYPQAAFNVLWENRPDLAEIIRGTDKDPFYLENSTGAVWVDFTNFVHNNW